MAEHIDEQVSALVDGELSKDECKRLMEEMRADVSKVSCWGHYHLISDALKNNLPASFPPDFTARVSQALESEPPLAAPLAQVRRLPSFAKPAIGFALAASVATVAYLGLGWDTTTQPVNTVPQLAFTPSTTPLQAYPVSKVRGREWDVEQPAVVSRLNDYLVSHGQYSALTGIQQGVLPRVRIVGYEQSEVPPPTFNEPAH